MSVVAYAWGMVALAGSLGLLTGAAVASRRRLLPDWNGAPAALAGVALLLCWVFAVSYALGAVGAFRSVPLLVTLNGGAAVALLLTHRSGSALVRIAHSPLPEGAIGRVAAVIGAVGAVAVAVSWLPGTAHTYRYGIFEPDSTWYHGHFVVRFLQTGWLTRINPVGTDALVPYHPANREVLDALLAMPWHRDLALPLVGLAALGLLFLAGWCVGARWNRGPAALLVTALIAGPPVIRLSQPGSLKNDLLAAALLVTGVALFVHSDGRIPAVALAGATLGLAVGTRANLLVPVLVLLLVGTVVLVRRRREAPVSAEGQPAPSASDPGDRETSRWLVVLSWLGAAALFGTYWYVRNWVRAGNPLPWTEIDIGPLHLRRAGTSEQQYFTQTILHWRHDPDLIRSAIHPGLRLGLGELWWGWAVLGVVSVGLVAVRRSLWLGGLVVAGVVGLVAYLATPLTLVVEPNDPIAPFNIAVNTRYALPAAVLILLAGACATPSRRVELGFCLTTLALVLWGLRSTLLSSGINHDGEAADAPLALLLGAAAGLLTLFGLLIWPRWRDGPVVARAAWLLVPAIAAAVLAYPLSQRYLDRRYATPVPAYAAALWPASRHLQDVHLGIATAAVPYPYFGPDLSNRVEYIGVGQEGGLLRNAASCAEWMDAIRSRQLTHVALTPDPLASLSTATAESWTEAIEGVRVVEAEDGSVLLELPSDPAPPTSGDCSTTQAPRN